MQFGNGEMVPQTPEIEYEPTEPKESDDEMDTGMIDLF